MDSSNPFKWRHYQSEIILLNVRWYSRLRAAHDSEETSEYAKHYYALSYRDLEEMMREREIQVDYTTIYR
jgi:transposase-like protein